MIRIPVVRVSVVREGAVDAVSTLADTPDKVAAIVRDLVGTDEREHFVVVLVNARSVVTGIHVVSIGMLTASIVHPREVFRPAVVGGAAAVVIAHNHPSGDPAPSSEDRETTQRLVNAGKILGIQVLDHVIVTGEGHFSFRGRGLL